MKKLFKWFLAIILYYSGILRLFERFSRYSKDGFWILEYHRVSDNKEDILGMVVSIKHFEKQMRYLERRHNVISSKEAVEKIENHESLPSRSIAITFDDGYKDIYLNAYPVLKKFNIPATIFLVTDFVGTENLLWFDEVLELIKATPAKHLSIKFGSSEEAYDLSNVYSRNRLILGLLLMMRSANPDERNRYLDEFKALLQVSKIHNPEKILLNWQEIKVMSGNGIEFGSHGKSHTVLTGLNTLELEEEIAYSKKIMEQNINQPVFIFSYPHGREDDFNDSIVAKLRNAGYRAACLNILGKNKDSRDLFKLKRRGIEKDSSTSLFGWFSKSIFACEISGLFDLFFFRREREYLC